MSTVRAPGPRAATDYARTAIDRTQGRSMVISTRGIVASEHPAASLAGASILARGGHAVDAAIAANAMMGVVSPNANGLGGDLFAIVYDARARRLSGINASGWAPAGLSIDFLQARGMASMPQAGIHAVTVPGVVAGWTQLHEDFGRQSMADVLAPAASAAEEGVPVAEFIAAEWASTETLLQSYDETARTYLPGGAPPRVGQVFRNPALARTLRQVGQHGRDAFYVGDIAQAILASSTRLGGTMVASDLAEFTAERIAPLSTTYRGWTVSELPPNGQGISALMMLNLMEQFPLGEFGHNSAAGTARHDRGQKARLRRYGAAPRGSAVFAGAGRRALVKGVRVRSRRPDRQMARAVGGRRRCSARACRRHDLPVRGRSRRQRRVAHPEQFCQLRLRSRARRSRVRVAEPRGVSSTCCPDIPTPSPVASVRCTRLFPGS